MGKTTVIALTVVLGICIVSGGTASFARENKAPAKLTVKSAELKLALRDLWVDHMFWVRNVVLSTKLGAGADAVKIAEDQAVKNARAIADSIGPFYGKSAADELFDLLAGHYGAVKEYMTTAYSGDAAARSVAVDKIRKNAEGIALFLRSANPNWSRQTVLALLLAHGGHHITQIDQINKNDFYSEARTWGEMRKNVFAIADTLADGIVKQFPKRF